MQENYEDGTKGEIKLVDWKDLGDEIKKSLNKSDVKSVTVSKTIGLKPAKITEEKENLMEQILKEEKRFPAEDHPFANCTEPRTKK